MYKVAKNFFLQRTAAKMKTIPITSGDDEMCMFCQLCAN